jgi:uncharacterized protein (TIGR02145 family)
MFGDNLFLPAAGYRDSSYGAVTYRGTNGSYWSSRVNNVTTAYSSRVGALRQNVAVALGERADGQSVRCIAE